MTQQNEALEVRLLHFTPLWVAVLAVRKCWQTEDRSDGKYFTAESLDNDASSTLGEYASGAPHEDGCFVLGADDKRILQTVIGHGHTSTIEHIQYAFEVKGLSRAMLQELARHRIASLSVQSSRYVLKRALAGNDDLKDLLVTSGDEGVDKFNLAHLRLLKAWIQESGLPNDVSKYGIPEALKTELVWSINARSLRNFLGLRTSLRAHREIRQLAFMVYSVLPDDHRFLFEDVVWE